MGLRKGQFHVQADNAQNLVALLPTSQGKLAGMCPLDVLQSGRSEKDFHSGKTGIAKFFKDVFSAFTKIQTEIQL